jgi:hypothetical protein
MSKRYLDYFILDDAISKDDVGLTLSIMEKMKLKLTNLPLAVFESVMYYGSRQVFKYLNTFKNANFSKNESQLIILASKNNNFELIEFMMSIGINCEYDYVLVYAYTYKNKQFIQKYIKEYLSNNNSKTYYGRGFGKIVQQDSVKDFIELLQHIKPSINSHYHNEVSITFLIKLCFTYSANKCLRYIASNVITDDKMFNIIINSIENYIVTYHKSDTSCVTNTPISNLSLLTIMYNAYYKSELSSHEVMIEIMKIENKYLINSHIML